MHKTYIHNPFNVLYIFYRHASSDIFHDEIHGILENLDLNA